MASEANRDAVQELRGVDGVKRAAVDDALRFNEMTPVGAPPLLVSLADDGEINFHHRGRGVYLDIGFYGDGQIHFHAAIKSIGVDVSGSEPSAADCPAPWWSRCASVARSRRPATSGAASGTTVSGTRAASARSAATYSCARAMWRLS